MSTLKNTAVVILSCDKYKDLWDGFCCLFDKYWSDCPYDRFFVTNKSIVTNSAFRTIQVGDNLSWSAGLREALKALSVNYDYVLLTLEDLYITESVDTKKLVNVIEAFKLLDGNYLRLYHKRKHQLSNKGPLSIIEKEDPYRINCVYSLWKVNTLLKLLDDQENAWDFERKGVVRAYEIGGFYVSNKSMFNVSNTVVKGMWVPSEYKKIKKLIPGYIASRPAMSFMQSCILLVQESIFNLFFFIIPFRYQRKVIAFVRNRL